MRCARRARASGWLLLLLAAVNLAAKQPLPPLQEAKHQSAGPLGMDAYVQDLEISVPSGAPAGLSLTVAPLLNDARWAMSQRWDDNLVDSLRVRDLLNRHQMHGTFYLNASDAWYSNESHYPFTGDPRKELGLALMQGGHSIGGHTLTHNFVPCLNRLEMFHETLGVRIDREVNTQSPVVSFVFPFTRFRNDLEGDKVHADIAELLKRGGYYHVANQYFNTTFHGTSGILDSWLLPCDGAQSIDPAVKFLLASERQHEREPVMCMCMHAWPAKWGGPAFPKLARNMLRWGSRKSWWYAQANELAAYRYQKAYGALESKLQGGQIKARVWRQEPVDLGDAGPLTLKLSQVGDQSPTARSGGQELEVKPAREKGSWLVTLPHAAGHGLPVAYEWHKNHRNEAKDLVNKPEGPLPDLASRLWLDGNTLHYRLQNKRRELRSVRLSWRLPLGQSCPLPEHRPSLAQGDVLALDLALDPGVDPALEQGRYYAAMQLDALQDGRPIRLYSDVQGGPPVRDASFPRDGFLTLGPLPGDRAGLDLPTWVRKVMRRERPRACEELQDQEMACWEAQSPARLETLHAEIIPAGGLMAPRTFYTWDTTVFYPYGHKLQYIMMSDIYSPVSQTVKAQTTRRVRRMQLNGVKLSGRTLKLKAGTNRLLVHYVPGTADGEGQANFSERNYGPFFRLVDGEGKRVKDIRYELPQGLTGSAAVLKTVKVEKK